MSPSLAGRGDRRGRAFTPVSRWEEPLSKSIQDMIRQALTAPTHETTFSTHDLVSTFEQPSRPRPVPDLLVAVGIQTTS